MDGLLLKRFANMNIRLILGANGGFSQPPMDCQLRVSLTNLLTNRQERTIWRWESGPRGRQDHMGSHINVHGYGKLSIADDAGAPLLVVYGGINVDGVASGVYMWKYMKPIEDQFHIFVAVNNVVDGDKSYHSLLQIVKEHKLTPPNQILYLFSGGYGPGMPLLRDDGAKRFSAIYLVDIWMGIGKTHGSVPNFYKALASTIPEKITYIYTEGGSTNPSARDHIASQVAPRSQLVPGTHMSTNIEAVKRLQ